MNKFKKRALRVVTEHLPVEEVDGIKKIFHQMDVDKNGNLSIKELKDGLHSIGHNVSNPDAQMIMEAGDVDGNGKLDYGEFITMSVHLKKTGWEEYLHAVFNYFDKNKSGFIEMDELRDTLQDESVPTDEEVIRDIFLDVGTGKDGLVSREEFTVMMKAGTDWGKTSRQYSRALFTTVSQKLFKDVPGQLR